MPGKGVFSINSFSVCQMQVGATWAAQSDDVFNFLFDCGQRTVLDSLPSFDWGLVWLFIFTFEKGMFPASSFYPLLSFIWGCSYLHLQAILHGSLTAEPRHCAWCWRMHLRHQEYIHLNVTLNKRKQGSSLSAPLCIWPTVVHISSILLQPQCGLCVSPTLTYYLFTGPSLDDLAAH